MELVYSMGSQGAERNPGTLPGMHSVLHGGSYGRAGQARSDGTGNN